MLAHSCFSGFSVLSVAIILLPMTTVAQQQTAPLVVHEWGTFTALQNEQGEQLMGINVDTEHVPSFVHNLSPDLLNRALLSSDHWVFRQKAVPKHHPQVSMRLETPVIYFYPPKDSKLPLELNVDVKFRGGWITEFYPKPKVHEPQSNPRDPFDFQGLSPKSMGHISWNQLQIGTQAAGPKTNSHVWVAPRKVNAANISTAADEHEKYLFYRGVGQQIAPIKVCTIAQGEQLQISGTFPQLVSSGTTAIIPKLWLMETRENGKIAYRTIATLQIDSQDIAPKILSAKRRFADSDFNLENRALLEAEMKAALLEEGLFPNEAIALLSTWQQAYFESPGLRLFYCVPRLWTDHFLPLAISVDAKITRVMVGRVELISDQQRTVLQKLAAGEISKEDWLAKIPQFSPSLEKLLAGHSDFGDLGVPIPPDFLLYMQLGRFRNALIAHEAARTHSKNLQKFIEWNHLQPFQLKQLSNN
jgi:hypothetical protein